MSIENPASAHIAKNRGTRWNGAGLSKSMTIKEVDAVDKIVRVEKVMYSLSTPMTANTIESYLQFHWNAHYRQVKICQDCGPLTAAPLLISAAPNLSLLTLDKEDQGEHSVAVNNNTAIMGVKAFFTINSSAF